MSAPPKTTLLGPDQAQLRDVMRRLADASSDDAHILSIYADVRPEAHGERPAERRELTTVRHRLDAIEDGLKAHTPQRESLDRDRQRIEGLFDGTDLDDIDGVAIFACSRIGLWEAIGSKAEFETQVTAGPTADLYQLARLLDDTVSAVVAIVDTNTCRLFAMLRGELYERPGADEPPDDHRHHDRGGWSQARYQRHVDMHDKRFAAEAATAIEALVEREKATHVLIAGNERSIGVLMPELSERVRAMVEHVTRMDMRARLEEVREAVKPILAALEEADARDVADRAYGGHVSGGLGVAGVDDTLLALEMGQVDELVIDEELSIQPRLRAELIRRAAQIDARVEIVRDHEGLAAFGGIGATLRFRL